MCLGSKAISLLLSTGSVLYLVKLMSHSTCHDNHLIPQKLFLVLGLESEPAIISQTQRTLHQRGTIMGDTQEKTLPFHMHTTAPGGRNHQSFGIFQLQDPDLQIHTETRQREAEGAALLHCSLNTELKIKSCRASGKALRNYTSTTGLPQAVPAAHLPHTLPPSAPAMQDHVLLLPSTQPSLYFKGHLPPHDTFTPSKSLLLRHLPAAQSFVQRQITPQSLLLLRVSVQPMAQMGRRHQMWVTLSLCSEADPMQGSGPLHCTHLALVVCSFHCSSPKTSGLSEDLRKG